jgi:hypothetical protein
MKIKQEVIPPHDHKGATGETEPIENHHKRHEVGGPDEVVDIDASHLIVGTVDGDRLPAISTTKKGAVPATGVPAGHFLEDSGSFDHIGQADVAGLESTATPQFAGMGIKTPGSDNHINLIEGFILGNDGQVRIKFNLAAPLLELLGGNVNIGDTLPVPGTGGTWAEVYDSDATNILSIASHKGNVYGCGETGVFKMGSPWTKVYTPPAGYICNCLISYGEYLYVGLQDTDGSTDGKIHIARAADGETWADSGMTSTNAGRATGVSSFAILGATLFIGTFQNGIFYTTNGTTANDTGMRATIGAALNSAYITAMTEGGGLLYAVTDSTDGGIYKRASDASWSSVYTATGVKLYSIHTWGGYKYAGGAAGKIIRAAGESDWAEIEDVGGGTNYCFIEYGGKLLVASSGTLYGTVDGDTWTSFYATGVTTIRSMCSWGTGFYAGTGTSGKVFSYLDTTYIPGLNLKVFGDVEFHGQFKPGGESGSVGSIPLSGGGDHPSWLTPGLNGQYIGGVTGGRPAYKAIPASDVVNTPAGNIEAVTIQAAIDELDAEKFTDNVSATSRILGRASAGAGAVEELTDTQVRTLLGLATTDSPVFVTVKLSGLTDGFLPYHVSDAAGLVNSPIYINKNNKVGIGTAAPSASLEIMGDYERIFRLSDSGLAHGMTSIVPTNVFFSMEEGVNDRGCASFRGLCGNYANMSALGFIGISGHTAPTSPVIAFWSGKKSGTSYGLLAATDPAFAFQNYTTRLMTILGSGNIGIGTATPASKLAINGGLHVGGDSDAGDDNILADGSIKSVGAFGCNNATPQTVYASGGAVTTAAGDFGFSSDAERASLTTLVSNIRAALVANGIMS